MHFPISMVSLAMFDSDLFNFPFLSDVWGTASDWMMVIVTGITAIYLIRTFRAQQHLNRIENERYLESIKPNFQINLIEPTVTQDPPNLELELTFDIENKGGLAKDIEYSVFTATDPGWHLFITDPEKPVIFPVKKEMILHDIITAVYKGTKAAANITFNFEFKDQQDNLYKQYVVISFLNNKFSVSPSMSVPQNLRIISKMLSQ